MWTCKCVVWNANPRMAPDSSPMHTHAGVHSNGKLFCPRLQRCGQLDWPLCCNLLCVSALAYVRPRFGGCNRPACRRPACFPGCPSHQQRLSARQLGHLNAAKLCGALPHRYVRQLARPACLGRCGSHPPFLCTYAQPCRTLSLSAPAAGGGTHPWTTLPACPSGYWLSEAWASC